MSSARNERTNPSDQRNDAPRSDAAAEAALGRGLLARGLVTGEELKGVLSSARGVDGPPGPDGLINRLVAAGALTNSQGQRALAELAQGQGQPIPGYNLMEKLGQGAMGVVYKARQLSLDRLVAVKVLHPKLATKPHLLAKLEQEAHLAARLSHNNVIQAIDVGSAGGIHYFVMELVEGRTIRQDLDDGKVYEEKEAVDIVLQVAQALAHAHRRGLIHRDVKPANIVLTTDGVAKLADLGLARTADDSGAARGEQGLVIGTPFYISPEQVEGRTDIDGRADLYALGATLYHMVTGQPPFPGKRVDAVLRAHLEDEVTPPDHINHDLSHGLGEVVEILLAKDRQQRYQNADDLIIDLECLLAGEAPKLARKKIEAGTLAELAEGEEDEEGPVTVVEQEGPAHAWVWIAILGGLFGLSALLNLILILRRR